MIITAPAPAPTPTPALTSEREEDNSSSSLSTSAPLPPAPATSSIEDDRQPIKQHDFKSKVIVMSGPPACGKGTICKKLATKYGLVHLSTGDIFREELGKGTELSAQANEAMSRRSFVPCDVVIAHILDRISQPDCVNNGCILDGFPRTVEQADALVQNSSVQRTFVIECPDRVLMNRAPGRRIDPVTGDIYHQKYVPAPASIQGRLIKREMDDNIRTRLDVFRAQLRRIALPHVKKINGNKDPQAVFEDVCRIIEADCLGELKQEQLPPPSPNVNENEIFSQCTICLSKPADYLVVPCGHQCGCEECLKLIHLSNGNCPICRTPIQSICKVYRAGRTENNSDMDQNNTTTLMDSQLQPVRSVLTEHHTIGDDEDAWPEDIEDGDQASLSDLTVTVMPVQSVPKEGGTVDVVVQVSVPETTRNPVDVCVVIDISGSMGVTATVEDEEGKTQATPFCILDIVKHSVKTVIKSLDAADRLSIVGYSDDARSALPLTIMSENGQQNAMRALEELTCGGRTNMWAGIEMGMNNLREGSMEKNSVLMLLTDGQPTQTPPNGYIFEMKNYMDTHPGFNFQLNSFGFGYNLDSKLLRDLAVAANGTYAFIPDSVIVGTTFVNSVANILSTSNQNSTLHLTEVNGAKFDGPTQGDLEENVSSWGRTITLGPLCQGQTRSISVPMSIPNLPEGQPYLSAVLEVAGNDRQFRTEGCSRDANSRAKAGCFAAKTVTVGLKAVDLAVNGRGRVAVQMMKELRDELKSALASCETPDPQLQGLYVDVDGRMTKAFNGQARFKRWGMHYLRALMRAHQLQCCTNFMDAGLQEYGGELFRSLRTKGDQIFLSLPPPTSTRTESRHRRTSNQQAASPTAASVNMNTYYAGSGGGCFAPWSTVEVQCDDGSWMRVPCSDVKKGDILKTAHGRSTVRCVVYITRANSKPLTFLTSSGLAITGGHPILRSCRWCLPRTEADAVPCKRLTSTVINFILKDEHIVLVEGEACVTWGHGLESDIVRHPFFGTGRILQELAKLPGWEAGLVHVDGFARTYQNGLSSKVDSDST